MGKLLLLIHSYSYNNNSELQRNLLYLDWKISFLSDHDCNVDFHANLTGVALLSPYAKSLRCEGPHMTRLHLFM